MSSISGVRRLHLGASSGGELPRYGVEVEDESLLAQVPPTRPGMLVLDLDLGLGLALRTINNGLGRDVIGQGLGLASFGLGQC